MVDSESIVFVARTMGSRLSNETSQLFQLRQRSKYRVFTECVVFDVVFDVLLDVLLDVVVQVTV